MKVNELIEILSNIKDKNIPVGYVVNGEFITLDEMIGVNVYADCVELQHEVTIPKSK